MARTDKFSFVVLGIGLSATPLYTQKNMSKYYTKKYLFYSLLVFIFLLFFGIASESYGSTREMLIKSFIFSSIIGLFLMNRLFHQKNLWVFIDNLQLSRNKLRIFNLIGYLTITLFLSIILT